MFALTIVRAAISGPEIKEWTMASAKNASQALAAATDRVPTSQECFKAGRGESDFAGIAPPRMAMRED